MNEIDNQQPSVIVDLYTKFQSQRQVSNITGLSRNTISKILKQQGVKIRKSCVDLKPNYAEDFFATIISEKQWYWLGFLWADGHLNRKTNHIRLELSSKDKIHLEKFCKDLCYPISKIKYRKDRDTNYVSFSSKKMSDDLKKLGFKFNLPDNINEHFLRGFFDGDGSIYSQGKTSVCTSIVGILPHLKSLAKLYPFPVNKFRSVSSSKDIFRIETHGIKSSLMLCDLMYTNASIYLDRKYNKYKHYSYLHNEGSETIIDPSFVKDDGIVHQI